MQSSSLQSIALSLVDACSRLFVDPAVVYARWCSTCMAFAADDRDKVLFERTERIFRIMWVAYEQWVGRGWIQYSRVALDLSEFYSRIRWRLVRKDAADPSSFHDLDVAIATAAKMYLHRVHEHANYSAERFRHELDTVLKELDGIIESGKASGARE
jgi:hypothetical protein